MSIGTSARAASRRPGTTDRHASSVGIDDPRRRVAERAPGQVDRRFGEAGGRRRAGRAGGGGVGHCRRCSHGHVATGEAARGAGGSVRRHIASERRGDADDRALDRRQRPSSRFPIYTRANVGEVFPDPVTPLTADVGIPRAESGWRDAWERIGAFDHDEFDPNELGQLGIIGGYCYLNVSMTRIFGERTPGLSWQMIDEQLFGAQPGIPPYEEEPGDIRPDLSEKLGATFGWVLTTPELPELLESQAATKALRADRPDLGDAVRRGARQAARRPLGLALPPAVRAAHLRHVPRHGAGRHAGGDLRRGGQAGGDPRPPRRAGRRRLGRAVVRPVGARAASWPATPT